MRYKLIITSLFLIIGCSLSYGQFSFGVSPGIGFNSAYLGYKIDNKFVPYIGFQYLYGKFKYEEKGYIYDSYMHQIIPYSETTDFSGNLYIPNIGLKYFVKQQNQLQAYFSLNIAKPLISGKLKYDRQADEEFNKYMKAICMWGGEFGFGIEYFLDENFSFGGEFGLRFLHLKYEETHNREIYNPNLSTYQTVKIEENLLIKTSPTFSKVSLNFYF